MIQSLKRCVGHAQHTQLSLAMILNESSMTSSAGRTKVNSRLCVEPPDQSAGLLVRDRSEAPRHCLYALAGVATRHTGELAHRVPPDWALAPDLGSDGRP